MKKKLKDVCDFYSGTGFPTQYQGEDKGDYPFYKVSDIAKNVIVGNIYLELCSNYIDDVVVKKIKGCILPENTVVFAKIGEALKLNRRAITSCACLVDNNVMGIAPRSEVLRIQYFYFLMKNLQLQTLAESTTVPSVRKTRLEKYEIEVPSLLEQEEIEKKLIFMQKVITKRKLELLSLDNLVKARFIEVFGESDKNTKQFPVRKLNEISSYWNGLTYKPVDTVEDGNGTLVLRSSNIQNGVLAFDDNVYVSCDIKEKLLVQDNDILMCSRNGSAALVGKTALIKGLVEPTTFGAFMMIIRSEYYSYLKTYFEMPFFRSQISTGTSTINQITGKMLNEISLPVPDIGTVKVFEEFVNRIAKSKLQVYQNIVINHRVA